MRFRRIYSEKKKKRETMLCHNKLNVFVVKKNILRQILIDLNLCKNWIMTNEFWNYFKYIIKLKT